MKKIQSTTIQKEKKEEYSFIHYLRILGAIAVVSLHTVSLNTNLLQTHHYVEWWIQTIVTAFCIWAVPVFVMISGSLLLNKKEESIKDFYKKRFMRVGIPALVWIPFYIIFYHYYRGDSLSPVNLLHNIIFVQFDHLYFLIIIIELYLLTPLLRILIKNITFINLIYLSMLFFYIGFFWKREGVLPTMFIPYLGYFLLGYALLNLNIKKKYLSYSPLLFFVAGLSIILIISLFTFIYKNQHFIDAFILYHVNPFIIMLSTAIFIFSQHSQIFYKIHFSLNLIKKIAAATLGIYIIHPFVLALTMLGLHKFFMTDIVPWYIMVLLIPYALICSYIITVIIKNVPYLKQIV